MHTAASESEKRDTRIRIPHKICRNVSVSRAVTFLSINGHVCHRKYVYVIITVLQVNKVSCEHDSMMMFLL